MQQETSNNAPVVEVDFAQHPTALKLLQRCQDFLAVVENLTPGKHLEAYLNTNYGPGHPIYEDLGSLTRQEATRFFSITAVYVDSREEFSGQHHSHPYGEINCVQGAGWTSPVPGTHHYPQFRGGRLVSLFFLPAGRISYVANPDDPQPASL
ncbi:uncharacterized protein K460DRAFT_378463 [Cucurbitaria berberidis CBS 394.84]|uniref:p-hydroxylaminobenzoate lyase n=1 Tax=Cucurbitaria berberidis CBS 394.84 TaxID=1168544 RepID=A0A9P4L6E8_9PLEO|nr:uncharacterized protein K460DRAFT_378463 [Cucurbitaria berberidis CBS 394.84]KAF1843292.1 hypothetical protein K460DRAFT_378463 [Cucurbitaria berberidis CBS 394.84]